MIPHETPLQLFTQDGCQPCKAVKRLLDSMGAKYVTIDITEDENAVQKVRDWGYNGTPVLWDGFDAIHGFNRDAIMTAVARRAQAETLF
jgi:glutaredoxin-like protein NrdH